MPAAEFVQPSIIGLFLAVPCASQRILSFRKHCFRVTRYSPKSGFANSTALYQVR